MTTAEQDTVNAILVAEGLADEQHRGRLLELARIMARTHHSAEGRTAARLEVTRLERVVGEGSSR